MQKKNNGTGKSVSADAFSCSVIFLHFSCLCLLKMLDTITLSIYSTSGSNKKIAMV